MQDEAGFNGVNLIPNSSDKVNQWMVPWLAVERAGAAGSRGATKLAKGL